MARAENIGATLDAADVLIDWLVADESRLNDQRLLSKLGELRKEHKKTLTVIEDLYRDLQYQLPPPEKQHDRGKPPPSTFDPRTPIARLAYGDLYDSEVEIRESELKLAYLSMLRRGRGGEDEEATTDSELFEAIAESRAIANSNSDLYFPLEEAWEIEETVLRSARSILFCHRNGDFEEEEENRSASTVSTLNFTVDKIGSRWQPGITVPKPFNMTIRDENAPIKAGYSRKFLENLVRNRRAREEARENPGQRIFKAKPPPASTFLPIFQELQEKAEEKRQFARDYGRDLLKQKLKPFNLTSNKGQHSHSRNCASMEDLRAVGSVEFRATPAPVSLFDNSLDEKLQEKEQKRRELRKMRAKHLLMTSSLPRTMQCQTEGGQRSHLLAMRRTQSLNNLQPQTIKTNTAATLRIENVKAQLKHQQNCRREVASYLDRREHVEREISEKIRQKLRIVEADNERLEIDRRNKLREAEQSRKAEYNQQLQEIEQRLGSRPSVLERQEMLIRKHSAQTRYRKALKDAGLEDFYLDRREFSLKTPPVDDDVPPVETLEDNEASAGKLQSVIEEEEEVPAEPKSDDGKPVPSPQSTSSGTSSIVSSPASTQSKASKSSSKVSSSSSSSGVTQSRNSSGRNGARRSSLERKSKMGQVNHSSERKTTLSSEASTSSHGTKTFGSPALSRQGTEENTTNENNRVTKKQELVEASDEQNFFG